MRLNGKLLSFLPLIALALVFGVSGQAFTQEPCSCGQTQSCVVPGEVGVCAEGTQTCVDGVWGDCVGPEPSAEICDDGLDNDCDGLTDCDDCECTCDEGCTLTQGYWKTHAGYGPQEMDPIWSSVGGPSAPLFDSGQSWIEAFWTSPLGGNAWYILAHQWMAATLNVNQASAPQEVLDALEDGAALLDAYDGDGVGDPLIPKKDEYGVNNPDRALAIALAGTLGDYNRGEIGPGHCE